MKNLILAPILVLFASCSTLDRVLGVDEPTAEGTEAKVSAIETGAKAAGDMLFPGLGAIAALAAGFGARKYVKSRKAAKAGVA